MPNQKGQKGPRVRERLENFPKRAMCAVRFSGFQALCALRAVGAVSAAGKLMRVTLGLICANQKAALSAGHRPKPKREMQRPMRAAN